MVRTCYFRKGPLSHPDSLFNVTRRKTRIDVNKSFANMTTRSPRRYLSTKISSMSELLSKERDFSGTPGVAVYVMLPLGIINMECELLVNPDDLMNQLRTLNSIKVDGVAVNICWGIVEANKPRHYNWEGYKQLFRMVRESGFKMQVLLSFHECEGDDAQIPLPKWIKETGQENPDIYFTDKEGRRNLETLTWGIDEEPVLEDRTAVEVYFEYMRSFRVEFDEFFKDGSIFEVEIGLGACGELRYPSHPAKHGWEYPGIGEFQCYDKYLRKSLEKAVEASGHDSSWGIPPDNAGSYNSKPQDTKFFCDGGDYNRPRGKIFLNWYSQCLIDHGDRVLAMANLALEGAAPAAKLSGMHWWDKTVSHAVERTAGFCDGYDPIASMLKKRETALNFTCVKPEGFVWQVLKAVWTSGVIVASENALPCYNRLGYRKILEVAKPRHEPYSRCISSFTYRGLNQSLLEQHNLREFALFVKKMHGTMNKTKDVIKNDNDQLNYVARPIEILDQKVKRLRNKTINQVKVKWDHRKGSDTTWESEEEMRRLYPHLFGMIIFKEWMEIKL